MFKKGDAAPKQHRRKYIKQFLKPEIGGCNEELNIIHGKNGYFYKIYRVADATYDREQCRRLIDRDGKVEICGVLGEIYLTIGYPATVVDEVLSKFELIETALTPLTIREIAEVLQRDVAGENLKIPDKFKKSPMRLVSPYDMDAKNQKCLKISGRVVKTCILYQIPSKIFPAFATELLALGRAYRLTVHLERFDPALCLEQLDTTKGISAPRKEQMRYFLNSAIERKESLYNVCALVRVEGSEETIQTRFEILQKLCSKYLISVSELDYQQYNAFKSTLPILFNRIQYNRVMAQDNVLSILPWSHLNDCKQNGIYYGDDVISGKITYNRLKDKESGFILSDNREWLMQQMQYELKHLPKDIKPVVVLAGENAPVEGLEGEKYEIHHTDITPALLKNLILTWAWDTLSINGRLKRSDTKMLKDAEDTLAEGEDFMERFLNFAGEDANRAFRVRPFPEFFTATRYDMLDCIYFVAGGTGIAQTAAYAAIMEDCSNMEWLYACNTELLAVPGGYTLFAEPAGICTYMSVDQFKMYSSPVMMDLIKKSPFLLIGEHKIRTKLLLSDAVTLDRSLKEWIAEPAKGSVLVTANALYQLKKGEKNE